MGIKKLVVVEFEIEEGDVQEPYPIGHKYSHFQDPETGKYYRPKNGFEVAGEDLEDLFVEI